MYHTEDVVIGASGFLWASFIGAAVAGYAKMNSGQKTTIDPGQLKTKGIQLLAGQAAAAFYMYKMWDSGALMCLGGTAAIVAVSTFVTL